MPPRIGDQPLYQLCGHTAPANRPGHDRMCGHAYLAAILADYRLPFQVTRVSLTRDFGDIFAALSLNVVNDRDLGLV